MSETGGWREGTTHVCDIIPGEEDLGDRLIKMTEKAIPEANETTLTDGSKSLELSEVLGAALNIHATETNANGTRGDNDDTVALLSELDCGIDDQRQNGKKRLMSGFVHNGTCSCRRSWLAPCASLAARWVAGSKIWGHDHGSHIWQVVFRQEQGVIGAAARQGLHAEA